MMRRIVMASLGLTALLFVVSLRADQSLPTLLPQLQGKDGKSIDAYLEKTKNKLIVEQQILLRRFNEFQQSALQLKERFSRSKDTTEIRRSKQLEKALRMVSDLAMSVRFEQLIDYLKKSKFKNISEVDEAKKKAQRLAADLRRIIGIIEEDNTEDLSERRKELERILKDIERAIREQKVVQAETKIGRESAPDLEKSQNRVTKDTGKIKDDLQKVIGGKGDPGGEGKTAKGAAKSAGKGDGKKGDSKGGEAKGGNSKGADSKGGDGKQGSAKKGGDGGSKKGGDGKAGTGKGKDGKGGSKAGGAKKGGDGKGGSKAGGSKKDGDGKGGSKAGGAKKGGDGKGGAKSGSKAGGSKAGKGGSKAGKGGSKSGGAKGGSKAGGAKKGGSKAGGSKAGGKGGKAGGQGKAKSGSKSGGSKSGGSKAGGSKSGGKSGGSKAGGSKSGGSKSGGSKSGPQDDQQQDVTHAKKRVEDAQGYQKSAQNDLKNKKNEDAVPKQEDAIKELEKAKKKLEELLRQLREEELERLLAALQGRCEKMLRMQIRVWEGTKTLHATIVKRAQQKANGIDQKESLRLSDEEKLIVLEATKAIEMLEAEGSAVAFPEVFKQVREDMKNVQHRLEIVDPGKVTIAIEQDIIDTLKEMIKALKKAQQEMQESKGKPKKSKQGPPKDQKLLDLIAELKMIRAMQIRVNRRTTTYGNQYKGEQADDPQIRKELQGLAGRQERIFEVTNRLAKGDNK